MQLIEDRLAIDYPQVRVGSFSPPYKAVFSEEITQAECQLMIDYLSQNKMPSLLEAGVPDVTAVAHKHGWVTYNGIMQTL